MITEVLIPSTSSVRSVADSLQVIAVLYEGIVTEVTEYTEMFNSFCASVELYG